MSAEEGRPRTLPHEDTAAPIFVTSTLRHTHTHIHTHTRWTNQACAAGVDANAVVSCPLATG